MKLTEAMAGATLLAFSNGATDIITTVVASGSEDTDDLAVGALFGASTFALTVILAFVIWARPGKVIKDVSIRIDSFIVLKCLIDVLTVTVVEERKFSEGYFDLHHISHYLYRPWLFQYKLLDRGSHPHRYLPDLRIHGLSRGKGQKVHNRR